MIKKVLLTGSNGFLGQNIKSKLDADYLIESLSRKNASLMVDLALSTPVLNQNYDLIIHAAGKAHSVPKTDAEKQEFFNVNVNGTQNLLTGLEKAPSLPKYFVFISSVSVYGAETGQLIPETAPLLAKDAYGISKIEAEKIVQHWCAKNNVVCTILRLPLLAGPNPPGNLGSMIKGIKKGYYFNIAGGKAKKSIVLAEDVARAIPIVAKIGGTYNLTDRYHPGFSELSDTIAAQLRQAKPKSIPLFIAKIMGLTGDLLGNKAPINSQKLIKIRADLTFNDDKAVEAFGWNPTRVLEGFKIE